MFCKKRVLRNFPKFTWKHLCQSLLFNKVAGLRPATLLKRETLAQVFSSEFCDISENTFFHRTPLVAASVNSIAAIKENEISCYSQEKRIIMNFEINCDYNLKTKYYFIFGIFLILIIIIRDLSVSTYTKFSKNLTSAHIMRKEMLAFQKILRNY